MNAFSLTKVAFQTGSMQLTSASKQRLDVAVDTMKKYEGYSYKVQGHTDSRGKEAFNLSLSTKRAESVKAYLVSKGIEESVLSAEGFGSSEPISTNDTKKGREENRRVVFRITQ
jgi:outer membrane protein OmpA-like peptidoglycan-associated protein